MLFLLLTTGHTQQIQITNTDSDLGYLLFSSLPIQIPVVYEHHCLRINLTEINIITESFGNKIKDSPRMKYLYNKLLNELNGITIHQQNRQKRGLFDIIGSSFKFLFGTLDENDRVQINKKIDIIAENSIQLHKLNDVVKFVNEGLEKLTNYENNRNSIDTLVYELMQFIEYIKDIEMGMQLSRLGLFNPKLLNYDKLERINSQNILLIKTSTWIDYKNNELLLISHIPINHKTINTIKIIPYPDHNGYQLDYSDQQSYFEDENKIYNQDNKEVNNECIKNIIKRKNPICNFIPTPSKEMIQYVEPNIILTWILTETTIEQNCQELNGDIKINGSKIIRIKQCRVKIGNVILSENSLSPEFDLTALYSPINVTKIKIVEHKDVLKLISENNTTLYVIIILVVIVLIIFVVLSKLFTLNPLTFLYKKFRKQAKNNQEPQQEIEPTQNQLPALYPEMPAQA